MALRAEFAGAIAVGKQNGLAPPEQLLGPIAVANLNRLGPAAQPAASVQRDHDWKRTIAFRLEKLRMKHAGSGRNLDRLRRRQWHGARRPRRDQTCDGK